MTTIFCLCLEKISHTQHIFQEGAYLILTKQRSSRSAVHDSMATQQRLSMPRMIWTGWDDYPNSHHWTTMNQLQHQSAWSSRDVARGRSTTWCHYLVDHVWFAGILERLCSQLQTCWNSQWLLTPAEHRKVLIPGGNIHIKKLNWPYLCYITLYQF